MPQTTREPRIESVEGGFCLIYPSGWRSQTFRNTQAGVDLVAGATDLKIIPENFTETYRRMVLALQPVFDRNQKMN
jgi:hypothetical protein